MLQGDEVGVGDLMTLLGQVGRDVLTGLAAAPGEEDAHDVITPPPALPTGQTATATWPGVGCSATGSPAATCTLLYVG